MGFWTYIAVNLSLESHCSTTLGHLSIMAFIGELFAVRPVVNLSPFETYLLYFVFCMGKLESILQCFVYHKASETVLSVILHRR